MIRLNENEVRVLGALMEKEATTPEYYPMSLNALTSACNQKTNRHPVVSFSDEVVVRALDRLRDAKLVWECSTPGSRVPKYKHQITDCIPLTTAERAALTVIMLRGPQTVGEIRGRSERLHVFQSTAEVEAALDGMSNRGDESLIVQLPRQAGQKESRFMHLLCGPVEVEQIEQAPKPELASLTVQDELNRIMKLEEEVAQLRADIDRFKEEFKAFAVQFQ